MSFVHPETIQSIQGLELRVKSIVEGFLSGLHKSPFHGFSVEFSEYRNYEPGDSPRYIDWKVYGKTDKLKVKKFEAETNLQAHILFDVSASMNFKTGTVSKLDYARNLAAAVIFLLNRQNDAVGVMTFTQSVKDYIRPKTGRRHLNYALQLLQRVDGESGTDLTQVIHSFTGVSTQRGMVIVFSDFMDGEAEVIKQLNILNAMGYEVVLFHVFDSAELMFEFTGRTRFTDMESGDTVIMEPDQIRERYTELVSRFTRAIRAEFIRNRMDYYKVITTDFYEHHLLDFLGARQRVG